MKSICTRVTALVLALFVFQAFSLLAQPVLGESWLLKPGDSYTIETDTGFGDAAGNLGRSGADQRWNFEAFQPDFTSSVNALNPRLGIAADSFPSASVLLVSSEAAGLAGANSEIYLQRRGNRLEIVGIASGDSASFFPVLKLNDPLLYQLAPLTFRAQGNDQTRARFTFPPEILTLFLGDSTLANLVDSVGLSIGQDLEYVVDSWGEVKLNARYSNNSFTCLRMRTETKAFQRFEVKVPFFGWIPINGLIQLPDSIANGALPRTIEYSWLSPEFTFPLVQMDVDTLGNITGVDQIMLPRTGAAGDAVLRKLNIRQQGSQLIVDLPEGNFGQGWIDVLGTDGRSFERRQLLSSQTQVELDASAWPSGVYLLTLWGDGRLQATGKAVGLK